MANVQPQIGHGAWAHEADENCPWCDQAIPRDKFAEISNRIAAREREQHEAMLAQFKRQAAQQKVETETRARAEIEQVRREAAQAREALAREAAAREAAIREDAAQAARAVAADELARTRQSALALERQLAELKEGGEARLQEALERVQREATAAVQAEQARSFEQTQKFQAQILDMQRQLERKTANELGEGAEIDLFEALRETFEGDRIRRVAKGANGADVIHEVIHNGKVCGKIIYDAKNRNAWQNEFANKLAADKIAEQADHAVLSSNKFPKGHSQLHNMAGVIIASPARVVALAEILRRQILQNHQLRVGNEERGHKTEELYAFITSERCKQLMDSIEAQAARMVDLDVAEEKAHRRTWDQRAKLIRTVQKVQGDLTFEIDRIIGTAGNGPELDLPDMPADLLAEEK